MNTILSQITDSLQLALQSKFQNFIALAPGLLGALAIFILGYVLSQLAYRFIIAASDKLKLDLLADKIGLTHFLKKHKSKISSSRLIAESVKGYLIFLFFIEATKVAEFYQVSEFLDSVMSYVPDVIVAVLIMLVGVQVGNTMSNIIRTSFSFTQSTTANVLGIAAKYTVLTFAALAALSQLEIASILVQTLFIGFVAMLTLAGGLAFGLGGKDVVKELLEAIKKVEIREYKEYKKELEEEA